MIRWSYPRRQQYRRLRRAIASGATAVAAGAFAVIAASAGALAVTGVLSLVMVGLLIDARSRTGISPAAKYLRTVLRSRPV